MLLMNKLSIEKRAQVLRCLVEGNSIRAASRLTDVAINYRYYNFFRIHQSLRVTSAMEAGVSDHVWTLDELVPLLSKP
jgi:hypothetical protein